MNINILELYFLLCRKEVVNYTSSGGIIIRGCALPIRVELYYAYEFGIGSVPYIVSQALLGTLEKVVIKRVNLVSFEGVSPVFNYVDTTNRIWFDNELTSQSQAVIWANDYLERKAQSIICP